MLEADAEMSLERINGLLECDRASDVELQKLAQRMVKPDGKRGRRGNWWIFDWQRI